MINNTRVWQVSLYVFNCKCSLWQTCWVSAISSLGDLMTMEDVHSMEHQMGKRGKLAVKHPSWDLVCSCKADVKRPLEAFRGPGHELRAGTLAIFSAEELLGRLHSPISLLWLHRWSGRFLHITGGDPSVCKSNRLLVDILRLSFIRLGYIL